MNRIFALLAGAAIVIGSLAIVPDANAHVRYFGRYGYYYGGMHHPKPTLAERIDIDAAARTY